MIHGLAPSSMIPPPRVRKLTPSHPIDDRASQFEVTFQRKLILTMTVLGDEYLFGWPGTLPFENLEDELFHQLPRALAVADSVEVLRDQTNVNLIDAEHQMHEFELVDRDNRRAYNEVLAQAPFLTYARYTVHDGTTLRYAVGAENLLLQTHRKPEMSLEIPRTQEITGDVVRWMLNRHIDQPQAPYDILAGLLRNTLKSEFRRR